MPVRGKGLASFVPCVLPEFGLFYLLLDAAKKCRGSVTISSEG